MDFDRGFAALGARFRATHDFARRIGLAGGYPNFNFAPGPDGAVFGSMLLRDSVAVFRDIRAAEIGNPPFEDIGARFRAVHVFARANGFIGAIPNFHNAGTGADLVYGTMLLKETVAEFRDVPAAELGDPDENDIAQRFRATHDWARRHGFMAGFPNFFLADTPRGRVHGTILIKEQDVEFHDLTSRDLFPQVVGAIGDRWLTDGGIHSSIGVPTSEELDFDAHGKVRLFSGGAIYWWPDTGAMPLPGNRVVVNYTGLNCFGITDGPGADDPYVTFAVTGPAGTTSTRTDVLADVRPGMHTRDLRELYRGSPAGLALHVFMMEHDDGDPNKFRDEVQQAYDEARPRLVAALATVPVIGPILGVAAELTLRTLKDDIVDAVNGLLGTGDDRLGDQLIPLSPKDLVQLAVRRPVAQEGGVDFKIQSALFTGQGSTYKTNFVVAVG